VKESAGKIFGDKKLETEGKTDKAADYRCATAAVWRRRRILWSPSRLLVIEGGPRDRARTGITGAILRPGSSPGF
jgi:hypothetical protein